VKNPDTGRYAYRLNPQHEWIYGDAPELRIVPQALWDAAKSRQTHLSDVFAGQIEGTRAAMRSLVAKNGGLNATHRPRTLLSGLLFCGCCGGTCRRRGHDRYTCTNHALGNGCNNARTLAREPLEARVLAGLRGRMMTPEMAGEAMRAYAEEANRLNYLRHQTEGSTRRALADTEKAIAEIVKVIEQGGWHRALSDRLTELEAKQDELRNHLAQAPATTPDIHPNISETYRRRIDRLIEALSHPDDAPEATDAIREVIDRIVITPRDKRGETHINLQATSPPSSNGSNERGNRATGLTVIACLSVCLPRSKRGLGPWLIETHSMRSCDSGGCG
jgi:hypothetical protein